MVSSETNPKEVRKVTALTKVYTRLDKKQVICFVMVSVLLRIDMKNKALQLELANWWKTRKEVFWKGSLIKSSLFWCIVQNYCSKGLLKFTDTQQVASEDNISRNFEFFWKLWNYWKLWHCYTDRYIVITKTYARAHCDGLDGKDEDDEAGKTRLLFLL